MKLFLLMNERFKIREDGLGWDNPPMKVVGTPRQWTPEEALRWNSQMLRLSPRCGKWYPRGVYKFKTWEDLERWEKEMQTRRLT